MMKLLFVLYLFLLNCSSLYAADSSFEQAKREQANELEKYYQELNQLDGSNINDYQQKKTDAEIDALSDALTKELKQQKNQLEDPKSKQLEKRIRDAFAEMENSQ